MFTDLLAKATGDFEIRVSWKYDGSASLYRVSFSDRYSPNMTYLPLWEGEDRSCVITRSTHDILYFTVSALDENGAVLEISPVFQSDKKRVLRPFMEKLSRGLIAVKAGEGIFLSWRLFETEVNGYTDTGLAGADFIVYRNGEKIALVTDSTNYLDQDGKMTDTYAVAAVFEGKTYPPCEAVSVWKSGSNYIDLPIQKPEGGVTPAGEAYEYHPNDMSVGDVNGDGEFEYIFRWEPTNSKDNCQRGYTGSCIIDCYTLRDGCSGGSTWAETFARALTIPSSWCTISTWMAKPRWR